VTKAKPKEGRLRPELKRRKKDIRGFRGLEYVVFKGVPIRESKLGDVIDLNPELMEKMVAEAVIQVRVPIRGLEVTFLRKTLAFSLDKFAKELGLTAAVVRKWELNENERLHPMNEAVVRAFFGECLNIELSGKLSQLVANTWAPDELVIEACQPAPFEGRNQTLTEKKTSDRDQDKPIGKLTLIKRPTTPPPNKRYLTPGEIIESLRKKRGLSLKKLSLKTKISLSSLKKVISDETFATEVQTMRLAQVLKFDPCQLLIAEIEYPYQMASDTR
jgi:transcriptional regulator with XRE-family HTH domain